MNGFIASGIKECEHGTRPAAAFVSVEKYRDQMGRQQPFLSDYILDVSEEVIDFADVLDGVTEQGEYSHDDDGPNGVSLSKANTLIPKRNRIPFFKELAGRAHRLSGKSHYPIPTPTAGWCILCRKEGAIGAHKG